MKILLVIPPADIAARNIKNCIPPLGIAYLAASLEKHGYNVRLLDCMIEGFHQTETLPGGRLRFGLSDTQIADAFRQEKPDLVGVSCPFSQMGGMAKRVLSIAKSVCPDATTVYGGLHPTIFPEDALDSSADIIFRGMGEQALPALLGALAEGRDVHEIPGVSVRKECNAATTFSEAPVSKNIDDIPFPAFHLLPLEKYWSINFPHGGHVLRNRVMPIVTSRGCPCRCSYCSAAVALGNRIAFRSARDVVDEIKTLNQDLGVEEIHFEDDNLIIDKNRALEIFRLMAKETPSVTWSAPHGLFVANMNEEMIAAMATSGCYEVTLSVESGVGRILTDVLGKPDYLQTIPEIVRNCRRHGIFVHGTFIVGWPGETLEEARTTIETPIKHGFDDATMVTWVPIPRTALYDSAVRDGIIAADDIGFSQVHMTARIPRKKGVALEKLWMMISRAMWKMRLRLLYRNPKLFYWRFVYPFLKNPGFGIRYLRDQLIMTLRPKIRSAS